MEVSFYIQVTSDRTKENGLKMQRGRFRLEFRKNFFTKKIVKYWNNLPRKEVEPPPLKVFKRCANVVLRDTV